MKPEGPRSVSRGTKRARSQGEAWTRREFVAGSLAAAGGGVALANGYAGAGAMLPQMAVTSRAEEDALLAAVRAADQPRPIPGTFGIADEER